MSDAHGSFNVLDIFPAVLCNRTVNGGTPVEVLKSCNAQCDSGEGRKTVLLDFLWETSRRMK
jgi:hypothetical protein